MLLALALLRAAPEGRLRRWAGVYRALALVVLLCAFVPFALTQLRLAVYPQLDVPRASAPTMEHYGLSATAGRVALDMPAPPVGTSSGVQCPRNLEQGNLRFGRGSVERNTGVGRGDRSRAARRKASEEPGVIVQAGPGRPQWRYHQYSYSWSGPVEADATARFVISPPWLTRLWRLAGVLLSIALLLALTRTQLSSVPQWLRSRLPARAAVLLVGCVLGTSVTPRAEAASTPDPALLGELQTRLLARDEVRAAVCRHHRSGGERRGAPGRRAQRERTRSRRCCNTLGRPAVDSRCGAGRRQRGGLGLPGC